MRARRGEAAARRWAGATVLSGVTMLAAAAGCSSDSNEPDVAHPASAEFVAPERGHRPVEGREAARDIRPASFGDSVRQRLQAERDARDHARTLITASFQGIDERGFPVVRLRNETGKAIDDVRGGFHIEDASGGYVFSSGYTEAVGGDIFLAKGAAEDLVPFGLNRKPAVMERLRSDPASLRVYFEVIDIVYADGTRESLVD